jgi:hypothetical protein
MTNLLAEQLIVGAEVDSALCQIIDLLTTYNSDQLCR